MARKWKVGELAIIHDPYDCYGLVDLEGELVVIEEISGNDYVARDRTSKHPSPEGDGFPARP